jgi:hypothetical protein
LVRYAADLQSVAAEKHWEWLPDRGLGVARAVYLRLPPDAQLWRLDDRFEPVDRGRLRRALAI